VIALSYGIKISTVHGFVTKQAWDIQTDGQNYNFQDRAKTQGNATTLTAT